MFQLIIPTKHTIFVWVNAIFLLALLLFGIIDGLAVVLGYFLETVVIGAFHSIKLLLAAKYGRKDPPQSNQVRGFWLVPFFIFHYGMFIGVQTMILFSILAINQPLISSGFDIPENIQYALSLGGMEWVLGSIILINTIYFITNYLMPRRYMVVAPSELFFKPYMRIVIQQFTVILSGFLLIFLPAALGAAILLIVLRWFTDCVMFAIRTDSAALDYLAEAINKEGQSLEETKEQLQQLSE